MRTVSLGILRTKARQRADMENSQFVSDSEINSYISDSATELYDLLITAGAYYSLSSTTLTLINGTDTYSLPTDFYKLAGVDLVDNSGNSIATLKPFQFAERNNYVYAPSYNLSGLTTTRYMLQNDSLKFIPSPAQANTLKVWYCPIQAALVNDSDTIDGVDGWEEYVVIDAAIKCLIKEESDISALEAQKASMLKRISDLSVIRNIGDADKVQDVTKTVGWEFWQYGGTGS